MEVTWWPIQPPEFTASLTSSSFWTILLVIGISAIMVMGISAVIVMGISFVVVMGIAADALLAVVVVAAIVVSAFAAVVYVSEFKCNSQCSWTGRNVTPQLSYQD